jgi:hypothetical protein
LALSVPLSRFTPRVGGGSAFYVRHLHDTLMRTPEEWAHWKNAQEQTEWLFDKARTPREILRFMNCTLVVLPIYQLARDVLQIRISEEAEASSTRLECHTVKLVHLTYVLAALTLGLLIFEAAHYICH